MGFGLRRCAGNGMKLLGILHGLVINQGFHLRWLNNGKKLNNNDNYLTIVNRQIYKG